MAFHNDPPVRQITWPADAVTGQTRIVAGADTPPELVAYGVTVALLFYVIDVPTGLEVGYFFIGISNVLDTGTENVLLTGQVVYPTPGVPSSATAANVKTNHQINLADPGGVGGRTVFKDYPLRFVNGAKVITELEWNNNPDDGGSLVLDPVNNQFRLRAPQPTINGTSVANTGLIDPLWYTVGAVDSPGLEVVSPGLTAKARATLQLIGQTNASGVDNTFAILNAANILLRGNSGGNTAASIVGSLGVSTTLAVTGDSNFDGTLRLGPNDQEIGQGVIAGAHALASSAAVGAAETVILTTNSATWRANHTYRATVYGEASTSVVALANNPLFRVRKTNAAGQNLGNRRIYCPVVAPTGFPSEFQILFDVGAADVTSTICLTIQGAAGYNGVHVAGATNGRGIYIEDIGSALNPALSNANIVTLV